MLQGAVLSTLFLLLRFSTVQLIQEEAVVCESDGYCVVSDSKPYYDDDQCEKPKSASRVIFPSYGPSPPAGRATDVRSSRGVSCSNEWNSSGNVTDIVLESMELSYVSTSTQFLSLCVSWELASSSGQYGGLQIDYVEHHVTGGHAITFSRSRFCVKDPTRRKLCLNDIKFINLHKKLHMIEILPYPHYPDDDLNDIRRRAVVRSDIAGCADIPQANGTTCGLKKYDEPRNIALESCLSDSGLKKDLRLTWDPPAGAEVPPESYIAIINDGSKFMYLNITDSKYVVLKGMNSSLKYTVEMKAFRQCSGLGSAQLEDLGFGTISGQVREKVTTCSRPTHHTIVTSVGYKTQFQTASSQTAQTSNHHLSITLGTIGAVLIAGLALTVLACILLKRIQNSSLIKTAVYPKPLANPKVLVFYSPSICESRLKSLQERIVCLLLEYFEVVTPDSITSGNISMWLEDTMKSVDSILMVANKEFCCDWNRSKDERSPVMNSLELLISSAAAQNSVGKFGFVSGEDDMQDVFVPDHSYLKLMPVFLLGKKKCDIDKLYQFVTKSRGIELEADNT